MTVEEGTVLNIDGANGKTANRSFQTSNLSKYLKEILSATIYLILYYFRTFVYYSDSDT